MEQIRILCFGDSLTEGYTHSGMQFHPYAGSMKAYLQKAFPAIQLQVDVEGLSGDKVCPPGLFMRRIEAKCKSNFYDWVLLLGGTNDLGWGDQPDKIFTCLQNVEQVPLQNGANILVMTVPEIALDKKNLNDRRDALNAAIIDQCDDSRIFLFDLHTKIPYHSLPPNERNKLWDDGVHFTAVGYDLMGEYIAERLMQVIPLARFVQSKSPKKVGNPVDVDQKIIEKGNENKTENARDDKKSEVRSESQGNYVFHSDLDFDSASDMLFIEKECSMAKRKGCEKGSRHVNCGICVIQ